MIFFNYFINIILIIKKFQKIFHHILHFNIFEIKNYFFILNF